jgi:MFS superfamily sulfate permease-like transporter
VEHLIECRLGFIVDFLSHAAIVGFMGGAATVVCLQQLKSILGLEHFTHEADIVSVMKSVFTQTREVQLVETLQLDSYFVLLLRDTSVVFFIPLKYNHNTSHYIIVHLIIPHTHIHISNIIHFILYKISIILYYNTLPH